MKKYYALLLIMVLSVPALWIVNVWQSNTCREINIEIKRIERAQERLVNDGKAIANEILDLVTVEKLEEQARKMGMQKMRPEDVIIITMRGNDLGN